MAVAFEIALTLKLDVFCSEIAVCKCLACALMQQNPLLPQCPCIFLGGFMFLGLFVGLWWDFMSVLKLF